jgi:cobalt-zinc-cadmium efflux system membrane fusion protein
MLSCSNSADEKNVDGAVFKVEGDIIKVTENAPLLKNIKIGEAATVAFAPSFSVSGEVKPLPGRYAEIAAPFAGRIVKSYVRAGQKVAVGAPVFDINSPDFSEMVKIYFQARQELALAEKTKARMKGLLEHNSVSVKEMEEAETDYGIKLKEFQQAQAALKIWVPDTENLHAGQPLTVCSPIAGEIVKEEITVGQYVKDDADALAAVADIATLRVIARIREKDISMAKNIDRVTVSPILQPELKIEGKLVYIGAVIDPETRLVDATVECNNSQLALKPNMFVSVAFKACEHPAIEIPAAAVLQEEDSRYVIISDSNTSFHKAKISILSEHDGKAIVSSGLKSGDRIITEGAFYFVEAR